MSIAAADAREDKEKWLLRPLNWALTVSCYVFIFGAFFWFEDKTTPAQLSAMLLSTLGICCGLMIWGIRRVMNAARGRYNV